RAAALRQVAVLRALGVESQERLPLDVLVADRQVEAVAEGAELVLVELLGLVGDVLALARGAHAVALHGAGDDHGGLALVLDSGLERGVDLHRVVAAAVQAVEVLVREVGDQRLELGRVEEALLELGPAERGVALGLAVDQLLETLDEHALLVALEELVPGAAP